MKKLVDLGTIMSSHCDPCATLQIRSLVRMPIKKIKARQIYDSRGNPTVEVDLTTEKE